MTTLNPNPPEICNSLMTYRYVSDFAVITFTVPVHTDWSEEMCDTAAQDDLESYVTNPEAYALDECWTDGGLFAEASAE
jgi:hypothetical protein